MKRWKNRFGQYVEQRAQLYLVVKEREGVVLSRPMFVPVIPLVLFLLFLGMGEVAILGDMIWDDDLSERLLGAAMFVPVTLLMCVFLYFVRILLRTYLWIYDHDLPSRRPCVGSCITAGEIEKVELNLERVAGYRRGHRDLAWSIHLRLPKKMSGRKIYACLASPNFLRKRQNRERSRAEALTRRLAERWHVEPSGVRREQAS